MKSKHMKKIAAMSMAVLMTGTVCGSYARSKQNSDFAITASAAGKFIADTDNNGAINIDESQIKVTQENYTVVNRTLTKSVSGGIVSGATKSGDTVPMLDKATITLKLKGTGLTTAKLKEMKLPVTYNYNGVTSTTHTWENPTVTSSNGVFTVKYKLNVYGTTLNYKTTKLSGVTDLKVTSAVYKSVEDDASFLRIKADAPTGYDDMFIRIKQDNCGTKAQREKWAKRLCVYSNSLSDMTGVKHDTNFMFLDNEYTGQLAFSNSFCIDGTGNKYAFTAFNIDSTNNIKADIKNTAKTIISWTELHEISHSYGYAKGANSFYTNYIYHDEALTNVRGLTAIQNCDNLRNVDVRCNKSYYKYGAALANYMKQYPHELFGFGEKLQALGDRYQYDRLEEFFGVKNSYVNKDISYTSANNKDAAQVVKDVTGTPVNVNNTNYLKYVNILRSLYMITWYQDYYHYNFKSFVENNMDTAAMKSYIEYEMNSNNNFK